MIQNNDRNDIITDMRKEIGSTKVLKIDNLYDNVTVFAKLEYLNPTGSIKDRTCLYMINKLLEETSLSNKTIVCVTSGNFGISVAWICKMYKLKCLILCPSNTTESKIRLMKAYKATVINDFSNTLDGIKYLDKLLINDTYVYLDQFSSAYNIDAHYYSTAKEIYKLNPDAIICGMGSGGTIMGISKYFKEHNSSALIIGIDNTNNDIEGLGINSLNKIVDKSYIDIVYNLTIDDAIQGVKLLRDKYGILVGLSSGATIKAISYLLKVYPNLSNIVCIFPDSYDRYLSIKGVYLDE